MPALRGEAGTEALLQVLTFQGEVGTKALLGCQHSLAPSWPVAVLDVMHESSTYDIKYIILYMLSSH